LEFNGMFAPSFVTGDTLSMGDIAAAVHLGRLFRLADGRLRYANLER